MPAPTSSSALKWGILGTAQINRRICPLIEKLPTQELVALGSRDLSKAQQVARELHVPEAYGSYEEVLSNPQINAIYLSLPNALHFEWTKKAIEAGKHVLCEKPLALKSAQVEVMRVLAQKKGVVVAEGLMYRHHPQTKLVKEIVESGRLGQIKVLRCSFHTKLDLSNNIRANAALGGGAMWDLGCYILSYLHYLVPQSTKNYRVRAEFKDGVDFSFVGHFEFDGAVVAQFDCGFNELRHESLEVIGEKGVLRVERPFKPREQEKLKIITNKDSEPETIDFHSLADSYEEELKDFQDAASGKRKPEIILLESAAYIASIEALLDAARG